MPLIDRAGVPEHIRALTSRHVLGVEADITARLAARANAPVSTPDAPAPTVRRPGWITRNAQVVAALGGDAQLLVIEGAAGAGKTTTLAAARAVIEERGGAVAGGDADVEGGAGRRRPGRRRRVVGGVAGLPARVPVGRRTACGRDSHPAASTRPPASSTPVRRDSAALRRGDVLLVDEAGMLDQDTARALLTIADDHGMRGSRWWGTGTNFPRSGAAACSTSPPATPHPART